MSLALRLEWPKFFESIVSIEFEPCSVWKRFEFLKIPELRNILIINCYESGQVCVLPNYRAIVVQKIPNYR
jgi:hypothetical protein